LGSARFWRRTGEWAAPYGFAFLCNVWYPGRLYTVPCFLQGSMTLGFDLLANL
jgi:hypothetical protein